MLTYYDFDRNKKNSDINLIFDNWKGNQEKVVIYAPHDDDGFLGPGYLLHAAQENGAECFIFIFCNGCAGYSDPRQKDDIVTIRKKETLKAYSKLNIDEEHIIRFEYPDFSANTKIGWQLLNGEKGSIAIALRKLREIQATRVLIPNGYREHLDHEAVSRMGLYHAPQAGDPILADWGEPTVIKTVLEYSVWGNFSPEDFLVNNRRTEIRANCAVAVNWEVEEQIRLAIKQFKSQSQIIDDLIKGREERKFGDKFLEVYRKIDPRPKLHYQPYIDYIKDSF